MNFYSQTKKQITFFIRKGGKTNRRMQAKRMLAFAHYCESKGAKHIGQVGSSHVIGYYGSIRNLSDATRLQHYYAIKTLYSLFDKHADVPKPKPLSFENLKGGAVP